MGTEVQLVTYQVGSRLASQLEDDTFYVEPPRGMLPQLKYSAEQTGRFEDRTDF